MPCAAAGESGGRAATRRTQPEAEVGDGSFWKPLRGSKEKELPPLDANSPAAQRLGKIKADLEAFVGKMNDRLEFVPADDAVYCFIGKPPAMFGMVWFSEGRSTT